MVLILYSRSLSKISRVIPGHVGAKCEICHLNYLGQGACEVRNLPDQGKNKALAGMYKGNPDFLRKKKGPCGHVQGKSGLFEGKKGPCGHVQGKSRLFEGKKVPCGHVQGKSGLFEEKKAPAGMYKGDPDF